MRGFKDFFGSRFGGSRREGAPEPGKAGAPAPGPELAGPAQLPVAAPYKKGDFIGQKYEVYGTLGKGGCGVVYLVYCHETEEVYALKTFRDEYIADAAVRERFRQEAQVWVDMERHPYLVRASFVEQIAGRLYVVMEYIAPDESGLNTLEGYLASRPPDLAQSLRWAIQFCYGMEYAYSKGLRCHRDIKPANIMIGQDRALKIADFGLAGTLGAASGAAGIDLGLREGRVGLSGQTMDGASFGTPTHMPPEQFVNAASCDERSDIYAFGVVLYQLAAGGRLPFLAPLPRDGSQQEQLRFWRGMHELHGKSRVPRLDSPLRGIVERCLEKEPGRRYQRFGELRQELEALLKRETGEVLGQPELGSFQAWEWSNKGISLGNLGRYDESVRCFDRMLEIDPRQANAWYNKGHSLGNLGRYDESVRYFDRALAIDPRHAGAWYSKGISLSRLSRHDEAVRCHDMALEIDPWDARAWNGKGASLYDLGRRDEALRCYDRALAIDSRLAHAWNNKGVSLAELGRYDEAVRCYEMALEINPQEAGAWSNKGTSLEKLGRFDESVRCFDRMLEIDPRHAGAWYSKGISLSRLSRHDEAVRCYDMELEINPRLANAWNNKGICHNRLGGYDEAMCCFDRALAIDPRDAAAWYNKANSLRSLASHNEAVRCYDSALEIDPQHASAWYNKGNSLSDLGRHDEAVRCFDRALAIDPRLVDAWLNKGNCLHSLGRDDEAVRCYDRAVAIDPRDARAWHNKARAEDELELGSNAAGSYRRFLDLALPAYEAQVGYARQRLRELEGH